MVDYMIRTSVDVVYDNFYALLKILIDDDHSWKCDRLNVMMCGRNIANEMILDKTRNNGQQHKLFEMVTAKHKDCTCLVPDIKNLLEREELSENYDPVMLDAFMRMTSKETRLSKSIIDNFVITPKTKDTNYKIVLNSMLSFDGYKNHKLCNIILYNLLGRHMWDTFYYVAKLLIESVPQTGFTPHKKDVITIVDGGKMWVIEGFILGLQARDNKPSLWNMLEAICACCCINSARYLAAKIIGVLDAIPISVMEACMENVVSVNNHLLLLDLLNHYRYKFAEFREVNDETEINAYNYALRFTPAPLQCIKVLMERGAVREFLASVKI
jgi:hypothetical protein